MDPALSFEFNQVINARTLSEWIGMNQSLPAQYISGYKRLSKSQVIRMLNGVHQIGKDLSSGRLLLWETPLGYQA